MEISHNNQTNNQTNNLIRNEAASTMILGIAQVVASIVKRILTTITLMHFWAIVPNQELLKDETKFMVALANTYRDLALIVSLPFALVALELTAGFTLIWPQVGVNGLNEIVEFIYQN